MWNRREFALAISALTLTDRGSRVLRTFQSEARPSKKLDVASIDRTRVLAAANRYLQEQPITVTASLSPRSAGGLHDFFSEGDYWWPDPKNPGGPYTRRDGFSNPANFNAHREAMVRLSIQMPALTAAWWITKQKKYAIHAAEHLRSWFVSESTRMNPNLEYAQAIFGVNKGRGIGIIDTLHLVEVARAASLLGPAKVLTPVEDTAVHQWFEQYLHWLTTSKNGMEERDQTNNHGSCWVMQAAEFAHLTKNSDISGLCRNRFRTALVPTQVAPDGSFPLELARTKPYSYSLFNLDVLATVCQILSTPVENLWQFATTDGRGIRKAVAFMFPFIQNKKSWPYAHDVEYFDDLPVRQPSLLFAGLAYSDDPYLKLWQTLNPDPTVAEIIRNYPIRQPLLWMI